MKIGFDAKRAMANFSGLGNYSRYIIDVLSAKETDSHFTLFIPKKKENDRLSPLLDRKNISCVFPVDLWRLFPSLWRLFGIRKSLTRNNVAIYHGLSNELPFGIARSGVKSVVTSHDLIFLRFPEYYKWFDRLIYSRKAAYAYKVADVIIAVSECTKRDIVEYYGIDPQKIEVVYQGCDKLFGNAVSNNDKKRIAEKYNLPETFLLSVGSIESRKNVMLAIKGLSYLDEHIHLVVVGKSTAYAKRALCYAREKGLSHRVHFFHQVPFSDLPSFYQMASVFVYPSFYEGFGIPVIEALSSGVPVVAAKGSCLEEAGGPGSVYIDPNSEKEFADAIRHIMSAPEVATQMIEEGKGYVARFSDEAIASGFAQIYSRLKGC